MGSGPQIQEAICVPAVIGVKPVADEEGWSSIAIPLVVVLTPVITTWMVPGAAAALLVLIDFTYSETCTPLALDSQPQKPDAGRTEDSCAVSVTLLRQAEAARRASEILERVVEGQGTGSATAARITMIPTTIIE